MKRLNQLLAAGLLFVGAVANAQTTNFSPMDVAKAEIAAEKGNVLMVDKKPSFKLWQEAYRLDKVEYRTDATVFHFRYVGGSYSYIMLYAPDGTHPWFLRDKATGKEFAMKGVYNVRHNGKLVDNHIETGVLNLHSDGSGKMVATCEVHFAPLPSNVKAVDLIEGKGTETFYNHFHVLDIKMKAVKTPVVVDPVVEPIEPVVEVVENTPAVNKATQLAEIPGVECTVFPNPATEIVNVKLSDVTEKTRMQLLSANGQVLWTGTTQDNVSSINVSEFAAGTYYLHVTMGKQTAVKAIVIE